MTVQLRADDYKVGLICATFNELAMVSEMLDKEHKPLPQSPNDSNIYTFGRCASHNVVIAVLPAGQRGTNSSAAVASEMKFTFKSLRIGLFVGSGGGVPTKETDIRIGDVVVSQPVRQLGGVVQYDFGKTQEGGKFIRTGYLNPPPTALLAVLQTLKSNHFRGISKFADYLDIVCAEERLDIRIPGVNDLLFEAGYKHIGWMNCDECDMDGVIVREPRNKPIVHYGTIASGNIDVQDSETRQKLYNELGGVLCLETEAAGLMNWFPCLVICGICDYADSHKSNMWNRYAAATAAAYAKDLLSIIPEFEVVNKQKVEKKFNLKEVTTLQLFPFSRNDDVVIRENIFSELEQKLPVAAPHRSAALWGLGGSGKTQIALEFAYQRYEKTACSVFWVHAHSYARFLHDYKAIAKLAKLSDNLENEKLMSEVRVWIESQSNWLLVLDNADVLQLFGKQYAVRGHDNPIDLYSFIPQGPTGAVLWTTRDGGILGSIISKSQGINVGSMDVSEAKQLLLGVSNCTITEVDSLATQELLDKLDRLPLAIMHAAAYMRRTSTTIQGYNKMLGKEMGRWHLLKEERFDRHRLPEVPNSVMQTWQISMEYIRKENPQAYKILHIVAYFNNQDIPFELIKAAAISEAGKESQKDSCEETESKKNHDIDNDMDGSGADDDALKAVTRLCEFSFLRRQQTKNDLCNYEIHELVQEATRYSLKKTENEESNFSKMALKVILEIYPPINIDTWDQCETYLPHALKVSDCSELSQEQISVSELLTKVSIYLHSRFRSRPDELVSLKALKLRKAALGEKHPDTIASIVNLAVTYYQQGRLAEAEKIEMHALDLRKEILGEKHPDTIDCMANLAVTYYQQGRLAEAEQIEIQVLELRRDIIGEKHLDTIKAMANLAATYHQQDRSAEAENIKIQVLELRRAIIGKNHPETIDSMASLAATYHQQGRSAEAEHIKTQVLQLRRDILGDNHPDTIDSMASLAATYYQRDQFYEAEQMEIQVLELRKVVLGERHPDTIESMESLALTYYKQGRFDDAEDLNQLIANLGIS